MPMTSISGSESYVTVEEFIARKDIRLVGELVNDDGRQSGLSELLTHDYLLALLEQASGQVEVACMKGGRYKPADLAALTGNCKQFLKGLVSALAYEPIRRRRGDAGEGPLDEYTEAKETLKELASGEQIFTFEEAVQAGLPVTRPITNQQLDDLNLVSSQYRFMGVRSNRNRRNA